MPDLRERKRMSGIFHPVVIWVAVLLLVGAPLSFWLARGYRTYELSMVEYQPTPYDASEDGSRALKRLLEVSRPVAWTLSDGSRQQAYYVEGESGPGLGAAIVYAHGSPGTGAGLLPEALALRRSGYAGLLIDLPGYGRSEGTPHWGERYVESFRAGVDFVSRQPGIDPKRIGAHGFSNGGCVVARAAAEDPRISALVLVAAYTNLHDQILFQRQDVVPGMGLFALVGVRRAGVPISELDNERALRDIGSRPVLIIGGGRDHVIPRAMIESLQLAPANAEMTIFESARHVGILSVVGEPYVRRLESFWNQSLSRTPPSRDESRSPA